MIKWPSCLDDVINYDACSSLQALLLDQMDPSAPSFNCLRLSIILEAKIIASDFHP